MNIIVKKPSEKEISDFESYHVWECKPSTFNWYYDSGETCLVIEGDVTVEYDGGSVSFTAGDLVIFPKGLSCVWNVKKTIKKHYMLKSYLSPAASAAGVSFYPPVKSPHAGGGRRKL